MNKPKKTSFSQRITGFDEIDKKSLNRMREAYQQSIANKDDTRSALIKKDDLRRLVDFIYNECDECDGIRIFFVRPEFTSELRETNINQLSIAMVPTINYKDEFVSGGVVSANNYCFASGKIPVLFPGGNEHSGLCPPSCAGENTFTNKKD